MTVPESPPVIGLTTYRENAAWGVWTQRADLLPTSTPTQVVAAGGVPVLLPPATAEPARARAVVARLDGLVVCGGADVDPAPLRRRTRDPHGRVAPRPGRLGGWRCSRPPRGPGCRCSACAAGCS